MTDEQQRAWQKADDAWKAAGSTTPCYDPAYLAARDQLARAMDPNEVRIAELETALMEIRAKARFEQDQPTGLHMTCLSLIWRAADKALSGGTK